jgi:hypothetical protein
MLEKIFKNYSLLFSFINELKVKYPSPEDAIIDYFAYMPILDTFVLCWSSFGFRDLNRVLIPKKNYPFNKLEINSEPWTESFSLNRSFFTENDITPQLKISGFNVTAYIPICSEDDYIGVIRIIGKDRLIDKFLTHDNLSLTKNLLLNKVNFRLDDIDHFAPIIGKWAGNIYFDEPEIATKNLLNLFSSFFNKSHNMFFAMDFDNNEIVYKFSTSKGTFDLLDGFRETLQNPQHIFSYVAKYGRTEMCLNFPEDIIKSARPHFHNWEPDDNELKKSFNNLELSYLAIPLKVDDYIVGVFLVIASRQPEIFNSASRFIQMCIKEMGFAIDKKSLGYAALSVKTKALPPLDAVKQFDTAEIALELISDIANKLLPFYKLEIGFMFISDMRDDTREGSVPVRSLAFLKSMIRDILTKKEIQIIPDFVRNDSSTKYSFLVIPIKTGLDFVIYIYGPTDIITTSSLRFALEEIQATLILSFESASSYFLSDHVINDMQTNLALWAQIHDLKNDTSDFGTEISRLMRIAENGNHDDLKDAVIATGNQFDQTIETWKEECDRILGKSFFRVCEKVNVEDIARSAYQIVREKYPDLALKVTFDLQSSSETAAITYGRELQAVLYELYRNTFKHFLRMEPGTLITEIKKNEEKDIIIITIFDDVYESGSLKTLKKALRPTSTSTLNKLLNRVVRRILHGEMFVAEYNYNKRPTVNISIPVQTKPH